MHVQFAEHGQERGRWPRGDLLRWLPLLERNGD